MASLLSRREEARALRLARSQPESAGELQEFLEEMRERTVEMVLGEDRVRARLEGVRHGVLAADYREDKPVVDEEAVLRWAEIGIYDYDQDVLVVAVVDLREGTLVDLVDRPGVQPPVSGEELEVAKNLASRDERLRDGLRRSDLHIVAFPTPQFLETHARFNHRVVTLYLASERTHQDMTVTVDLSAQEVVPADELREGSPRSSQDSGQDR